MGGWLKNNSGGILHNFSMNVNVSSLIDINIDSVCETHADVLASSTHIVGGHTVENLMSYAFVKHGLTRNCLMAYLIQILCIMFIGVTEIVLTVGAEFVFL